MGNRVNIKVSIPTDENGLIGRQCPKCKDYFKLKPGTGLPKVTATICPYCGTKAEGSEFLTKEQVKLLRSAALNYASGMLLDSFKKLEFNHTSGGFGVSLKVTGQRTPIVRYRERKLETGVICEQCTLNYSIYGVFGFCPDCGVHNSLQILNKNLDLYEKVLVLAGGQDAATAQHLIDNALEDCVSAFDGFGRQACEVFSGKATDPAKAKSISFQNVERARKKVTELFRVDLAGALAPAEWVEVNRAFQKRHLLAHTMKVVDQDYLDSTGDNPALLGRVVPIGSKDVSDLLTRLRGMGKHLFDSLKGLP